MPIANRTKSAWTLVALLVTIIVVAMLNLGMNVVANSGPSGPLPLDISMDGQLFGIHSEDSMGLKPSVQLVRLQPEEVKVRLALPLLHARAVPEDVKVIGLVPPDQYQYSNQTQFVGELIARKLESITAMFRWREVLESYMINKLQNLSLQQSFDVNMHFKDIWAQADAFITERELFPETKDFQSILGALRVAPAINGSNPSRNTERRVYANLTLLGGRQVQFFPSQMEDKVKRGSTYSTGFLESSIVGFHLASLLGFRRVPYSVSRNFKLPRAAWRFRGVDSSAQSVLCSLCSKNGDNICSETSDGFLLSGTVIATLPSSLNGNEGGGTFHVPNPWALSTMTTAWQLQSNFCLVVERDLLLGRDPLHLDLMDLAATDYLMGYAIRRELEVLNSSHYPLLLLPYTFIYHPIHATSNENLLETLAPLFQCCKLRRSTFETLRKFASQPAVPQMALSLVDSVKLDLFQSGLTIEWLSELQRRLFELLSVVQLCVDRYGEDRVLFNDGFR